MPAADAAGDAGRVFDLRRLDQFACLGANRRRLGGVIRTHEAKGRDCHVLIFRPVRQVRSGYESLPARQSSIKDRSKKPGAPEATPARGLFAPGDYSGRINATFSD